MSWISRLIRLRSRSVDCSSTMPRVALQVEVELRDRVEVPLLDANRVGQLPLPRGCAADPGRGDGGEGEREAEHQQLVGARAGEGVGEPALAEEYRPWLGGDEGRAAEARGDEVAGPLGEDADLDHQPDPEHELGREVSAYAIAQDDQDVAAEADEGMEPNAGPDE